MSNELERKESANVETANLNSALSAEGRVLTPQASCPFCDEIVSVNARKCKHCGETLDVAMRKAEEAMRHSDRQPNVFMNAGGGAAAAAVGGRQLRPFKHFMHIILSVVTAGIWIPVWLLMYIFRNRSVYE